MVVDDDHAICEFLQMFLDGLGYQGITVSNAEQAVHQYNAQRPDAVIIDVIMPGSMDGLGALAAFKKIDQSFVRNCATDPVNGALVAAIVSMGHALGLEVTAEGVETAAELAYLRAQNCDRAQGWYFGKPVPSSELSAILDQANTEVH